jgi:chaperonin GroES
MNGKETHSRQLLPGLQVTEGGLLLSSGTTQAISDAVIGTILAKGEDVDIDVKEGDAVIFSKYSSSDVKVEGGEVIFVAQKSVLAVLS